MPQMEALRAFRFAGRKVVPGDEITATAGEAKTLQAMKWAKPAKAYATRVMVAETPQIPDEEPGSRRKPQKPRRQYRRRDMQAEN